MRILPLIAILMAVPGAATAQTQVDDGAAGQVPQRVRSVMLAAGQNCPKAEGDEIVVCRPADEPYRIPRALRDSGPIPMQRQSWVNRVADMEETGRVAGGLPNTCSPIGTGGQTGCSVVWARKWAAERRAMQRDQDPTP
jgi:hypothetical protein